MDTQTAYRKLQKYCAYQERCEQEVKEKLKSLGQSSADAQDIIVWLIEENFLNQKRFAHLYAGSKFRLKRWGRIKIKQGLRLKKVSPTLISNALAEEIDEDDYVASMQYLLQKKMDSLQVRNKFYKPQEIKLKLVSYLQQKGYESDIVWREVKAFVNQ